MTNGAPGWDGEGGARITRADMEKVSRLLYANSGIDLRPDLKKAMVVARLQKRVRRGGFASFRDYLRFVEADRTGRELTNLLDALTTNHTLFFREPEHFEFLAGAVVPRLTEGRQMQPISGWSAACATGEEAYSIVMTLLERLPLAQHSRIELLASDLSVSAVETARAAVYPIERVTHVHPDLLRQYFERGLGRQTGTARVKLAVRRFVEFRRLNLMKIDALDQTFHFIFCRNVMIYFDHAARQRAVGMLARHLVPRGFLFLSQCESLGGLTHDFKWCAAGVYQRGDA